ncbi:MAG: hypothetical protein ACRD4E_12805 [Bryobacteraceae bacterium]
MRKISLLFAVLACASLAVLPPVLSGQNKLPRTPEGKPNFSGTYEWPKSMGGERCRCSATIFDRKNFAPFKPGG